jgi:nucleoside-diphosphate-sugar epimerase
MSILVTGGTGFIGAEVVRMLLAKGEKLVIAFDINPSTKLLDDVAEDRKSVV